MNKPIYNLTNHNATRVMNNHKQQFIGPVTNRPYRAKISRPILVHNDDLEAIRKEHGPVGDIERLPLFN